MLKNVAALCLAAFFLSGCITGSQFSKGTGGTADPYEGVVISDAELVTLAQKTAERLDADRMVAMDNAHSKRLEKITKRLGKEDGIKWNFKVYMTGEVNIIGLPDGSVRVYSGMMDVMPDDDELLSVICHEMGHVKAGDSTDRLKKAFGTSQVRKDADAAGKPYAQLTRFDSNGLGDAFVVTPYSRAQEDAADDYALRLMRKHKRNAAAAIAAQRKLSGLGVNSGIAAAHPDSSARGNRLQRIITGS